VKPECGTFRERAARILRETPQVRVSVSGAGLNWVEKRRAAFAEVDFEAWRERAKSVKEHTLGRLDEYLEMAERRLAERGAAIHWAPDADAARGVLAGIVREKSVRRAVKAKSMLSEELALNAHLEAMGVEVLETDLGEYIIQLLGQPPSHIVGPAIHLGVEEIRNLFAARLGTPGDASPEALAAGARKVLREAFLTADLGISGANFLVAETGTLALIENEGNIRLSTSAPRIHVAFVGIEKLLPRFEDLALFLTLTARSATGQRVGNYISLLHGPRTPDEPDGPVELHVVFVDNGRSGVLADPAMRAVLRCVRCGACLNACPVFRQVGGHAYGWVYSGPVGAVLNPGLLGIEGTEPLPFASSLCGACTESCPVGIPLHQLLLEWRARAVRRHLRPMPEQAAMAAFASAMVRPAMYRLASRALRLAPWAARSRTLPVIREWTRVREGPEPSPESFRELWDKGIE
jgi:L-lactate dehydrogenase complex protein LldF